MKSFRDLLSEIKSVHDTYKKWGIMDSSGKFIHGRDHERAQTHLDLIQTNKGSGWVEWAQETPPVNPHAKWNDSSWNLTGPLNQHHKLNIRTKGKKSLAAAIEHFEKFPHVRGRRVDWDHVWDFNDPAREKSSTGSSIRVHNDMKAHYEKHYGKLSFGKGEIFEGFLREDRSTHKSYQKWGSMDLDGQLYSGNKTEKAVSHYDLGLKPTESVDYAQEIPWRSPDMDSSWGRGGRGPNQINKLNIRTTGKESLASAIKHFEKFPHVSGRKVDWDHFSVTSKPKMPWQREVSHLGDSVGVHNKMKAHYEKHYGKLS